MDKNITGYSGSGTGAEGCADVNECTMNTHNCADEADCTNTEGGFTCECKTGYSGNGIQCSGMFSIQCPFKPTSYFSPISKFYLYACGEILSFLTMELFLDVDECNEAGKCGENSLCYNTYGSYYCTCETGH